jgi:divalent metal cation (Fe/Co/Zn/Cd) transporter
MARASRIHPIARVTVATVLILAAYYIVPVEPGVEGDRLVARIVASLLVVVAATLVVVRQVRRQVHPGDDEPPLAGLAIALVAGVTAFALADYILAFSKPGQFVSMQTRTDALYFALATLLTVGYGDVYAQGQAARVLVSVQMLFNIAVLATSASFLVNQIGDRLRRQRGR